MKTKIKLLISSAAIVGIFLGMPSVSWSCKHGYKSENDREDNRSCIKCMKKEKNKNDESKDSKHIIQNNTPAFNQFQNCYFENCVFEIPMRVQNGQLRVEDHHKNNSDEQLARYLQAVYDAEAAKQHPVAHNIQALSKVEFSQEEFNFRRVHIKEHNLGARQLNLTPRQMEDGAHMVHLRKEKGVFIQAKQRR